MEKGFPRPRIDHENSWNGEVKSYPMPYTATDDSIANLDDPRMIECVSGGLCIVCGTDVDRLDCWALLKFGDLMSESGPFHQKCARMTFFMCPHVTSNGNYSIAKYDYDNLMSYMRERYRWTQTA